jgi:hypothetical protein
LERIAGEDGDAGLADDASTLHLAKSFYSVGGANTPNLRLNLTHFLCGLENLF